MNRRIYLDHNATTPLCDEAAQAISEAATTIWGNLSSLHAEGQTARSAAERAREQVAKLVGASAREIVFTSGATESINWAHRLPPRFGAVLTSAVEHPAVLGACERALRDGRISKWIQIHTAQNGQIDIDEIRRTLNERSDIALVSIMLANNEIGTRHPVSEIAELCRARGVLCHSDITQVVGREPVSVSELGVDLASFSAHKLYGPKGVGALFIKSGCRLEPLMAGGHQERGRRPGTENLLGIIGFGAAAAACGNLSSEADRQRCLRDRLLNGVLDRLGDVVVNGDIETGLANTLNLSFLGCNAEGLVMALDLEGVSVSAGSACSAGSLEPSHVILAITDDVDRQQSAVRFSLGRSTTEDDIDEAIKRLLVCVWRTR